MEFAKNTAERNKVATKLQRSRKIRRENKDTVTCNKLIIEFFEEPVNKKEFLQSERTYRCRMNRN